MTHLSRADQNNLEQNHQQRLSARPGESHGSSQGRGRRWKSLYSQIRPDLLTGPPVRLPPLDWKGLLKGGRQEEEEGEAGKEVGCSVGRAFLHWEIRFTRAASTVDPDWKLPMGSKVRRFKIVKNSHCLHKLNNYRFLKKENVCLKSKSSWRRVNKKLRLKHVLRLSQTNFWYF